MRGFLSRYFLLLFIGSLFLYALAEDSFCNDEKEDIAVLYYQGNNITDDCIEQLLSWDDPDGEKIIDLERYYSPTKEESSNQDEEFLEMLQDDDYAQPIHWFYVGKILNDVHLICGYDIDYKHDLHNNVRVASFVRVGDVLIRKSLHEIKDSKIWIENGSVLYSYSLSGCAFMELVGEMYPEIMLFYNRSCKKGLGDHPYDHVCGECTHKLLFYAQGSFLAEEFVFFNRVEYPSESAFALSDDGSRDRIEKKDIKDFALRILRFIDKDKPEALKEDGIAYSPVCFQLLLEDDLRNKDLGERSIALSLHKNDAYDQVKYVGFSWSYIGEYKDCYYVYANYYNLWDSSETSSAIYAITKEGDFLKKGARLAYGTEEKKPIIIDEYGNKNCLLVGNTLTYYQEASYNDCVAYMNAQFCLSDADFDQSNRVESDDVCGIVQIALELSDNGQKSNQTVIGFCPAHIDIDFEQEMIATHQRSLGEIFLYYANVLCHNKYSKNYHIQYYSRQDYLSSSDLKEVWVDTINSINTVQEII